MIQKTPIVAMQSAYAYSEGSLYKSLTETCSMTGDTQPVPHPVYKGSKMVDLIFKISALIITCTGYMYMQYNEFIYAVKCIHETYIPAIQQMARKQLIKT